MKIEMWQLWIIISILLFIAEIFIPTFFAASLAIGCLIAGVFAFLDFGIKVQLFAFSIGTLLSFFTIRPLMLKYAHKNSKKVKTNVEAIVGRIGRVSVTIDGDKNTGRVSLDGDDWKAESVDGEIINAGERVEVLKVDSTILTVKPIKKEE